MTNDSGSQRRCWLVEDTIPPEFRWRELAVLREIAAIARRQTTALRSGPRQWPMKPSRTCVLGGVDEVGHGQIDVVVRSAGVAVGEIDRRDAERGVGGLQV